MLSSSLLISFSFFSICGADLLNDIPFVDKAIANPSSLFQQQPSILPSQNPITTAPSMLSTLQAKATVCPTVHVSQFSTKNPTNAPSNLKSTLQPTQSKLSPTRSPTVPPTMHRISPSSQPTDAPTRSPSKSTQLPSPASTIYDAIVIGAGISGLTAAKVQCT